MSDVSAIRPLIEAIPGNKAWFVAYRKAGKQLLVQQPTERGHDGSRRAAQGRGGRVRCDMGTDVPEKWKRS